MQVSDLKGELLSYKASLLAELLGVTVEEAKKLKEAETFPLPPLTPSVVEEE